MATQETAVTAAPEANKASAQPGGSSPAASATAKADQKTSKAHPHKLDVDSMVESGTISKATGKKIKSYLKKHKKEHKAEREKVQKMTDEERKAYFENKRSSGQDMWSKMVEEGVITQDEADAIRAAHQAHREQHEGNSQSQTTTQKGTVN
jgi:polyhydroxyalkanoate synthesis regulator phasin